MSTVLVTGGTGRLGRPLVAGLRAEGHTVRVLSRRAGEGHIIGDLADGRGVVDAVRGVDAVVHAATSGRMQAVDVRGTAQLLKHARMHGVGHVVYVSIVGSDRVAMPYYKVKQAVEAQVAASGVPFTLARATQFHDLLWGLGTKARLGPLLLAPAGWRFEPNAPADFAASLVRRVAAGPAGGVTEFGGPQVLDGAELLTDVHRALGRTGAVRRVRVPGKGSAAVTAGALLTGDAGADVPVERGTTTWADWLAAR
ncbi:MAG: SDR family oxidoreductase [Jatrophihabitans sp.]|uniref:SDR family oxidoreductase n=1 Tax=Jatrophihabitans sp. TaxID=1932789 RepID=UPI003F8036DB